MRNKMAHDDISIDEYYDWLRSFEYVVLCNLCIITNTMNTL